MAALCGVLLLPSWAMMPFARASPECCSVFAMQPGAARPPGPAHSFFGDWEQGHGPPDLDDAGVASSTQLGAVEKRNGDSF